MKAYRVFFLLLINTQIGYAYETQTHEELTDNSYEAFLLKSGENFKHDIGISDDQKFSIGTLSQYTKDKFKTENEDAKKTPLTIMRSGATFEDDGFKPLRHFFDPYYNANNIQNQFSFVSPLWTLEDRDELAGSISGQDYSYKDAREYFLNAITSQSDKSRETEFVNLFRSLGHIVHHVQDMAQPQHVRNDPHLKHNVPFIHDPSLFEHYTQGVTLARENDVDEQLQTQFFAQFNGYEPVAFTNPRHYWHTKGEKDYTGLGLAEFTNREFVSKDTNFFTSDGADYPRPSINDATKFTVPDVRTVFEEFGMAEPALCQDPDNPCEMTFYSMQITDNLRPQKGGVNQYATTESIYSQDIKIYNNSDVIKLRNFQLKEKFTLNKINFWSSYPFLLSRAVGYSSGLLNYFFRGRLEPQEVKFESNKVSFKIKNAVDSIQFPIWENEYLHSGGELVVVYKYRNIKGEEKYGQSPSVVLSDNLYPQKITQNRYEFKLENIPEGAMILESRLVFKGSLGEEMSSAVAFGSVDPDAVLLALTSVKNSLTSQFHVIRSIDGGDSWHLSYSKAIGNVGYGFQTSLPEANLGVYSTGVGKAYIDLGHQLDSTLNPQDHIALRYCTEDAGLSWDDCSFTHEGAGDRPTLGYFSTAGHFPRALNKNATPFLNTGKSWLSFNPIVYFSKDEHVSEMFVSSDQGKSWNFSFSSANSRPTSPFFRAQLYDFSFGFDGNMKIRVGNDYKDVREDMRRKEYTSESYGNTWTENGNFLGVEIGRGSSTQNPVYEYKYENLHDVKVAIKPTYEGAFSSSLSSVYFQTSTLVFDRLDPSYDDYSISVADYSSFSPNTVAFIGSAYLGNGQIVLPYKEYVGVNYIPYRYTDSLRTGPASYTNNYFLRSNDYGKTWAKVSSYSSGDASSSSWLDSFLKGSNLLSGLVDVEAIPLKDDKLYIVK